MKIKGIFTLPKILEQAVLTDPNHNLQDPCSTGAPFGFKVISSPSNGVSVSWTNPRNCVPKEAVVVKKESSDPTDSHDGVSVPVNSDRASFTDTGTSNGVLYFYKVFLIGASGQISGGTSFSVLAGYTSVILSRIPDGSIVLDGQESDAIWAGQARISFSFPVVPDYTDYTGGNDPYVSGYIRFAYDSSNLYVFYHTNDRYLRYDSPGSPWSDDSLELYFDMVYNRASLIEANHTSFIYTPMNGNSLSGWGDSSGWIYASTSDSERAVYSAGSTPNNDADTDAGWNMEMKIPFSVLGLSLVRSGKTVGFTFFVNDDDLAPFSADYHGYSWTPGADIFTPSSWGILQFQ